MSAEPREVVCSVLAGPEALTVNAAERAALDAGQVRVEIKACGLNFPDVLMTRGLYQFKPTLPFVPGMEAAGVVVETASDVGSVKAGDVVSVLGRHGLLRSEVVVSANSVLPAPTAFSVDEAACYWTAAHTARHALVDRAQLVAGERVLVLGAAGGVGYACVQLAELLGAEVMAAASSDEKLRVAQQAGAQHTVNYQDDPLVDAVREHWPDGVDVIVDPVGGALFEQALRLPRWNGRVLVAGFASGEIGKAPANLALIKGYSIVGVRAGEAIRRDPALAERSKLALQQWTDAGYLKPHIGARYGLGNITEAMQCLEHRRAIGRILVTP